MISIYGDYEQGFKVYVVSDINTDYESTIKITVENFKGQKHVDEEVKVNIGK